MVVDGARLEAPSRPPPGTIGGLLRRSWDANKPLTLLGVSMVGLLLITVPLIFLDAREITGVRAWIKPTKFAVSGAIYAFTFLWMLSFIRGRRRGWGSWPGSQPAPSSWR
ncbi:MAG: hypothetical protein KY393_08120 [Actinobacteria bacterium]|nr:hypothetical protein [Actinomycetota bacterium]